MTNIQLVYLAKRGGKFKKAPFKNGRGAVRERAGGILIRFEKPSDGLILGKVGF